MSEPTYRFEMAVSGRALCQNTACKNEGIKLQKGEFRFGTLVNFHEHFTWRWKHWGCVTPAQIKRLQDQVGPLEDLNLDEDLPTILDGYDEVSPEAQEKIKFALEFGHVADEDWKGDPELNRPGQKGINKRAKKKKHEDEENEDKVESPSKPKAKKGRGKKAKAEPEDEDDLPLSPQVKKKSARRKVKSEDEEDDVALSPTPKKTAGRKRKHVDQDQEEEEEEKPKRKSRAKKVKEEEEDDFTLPDDPAIKSKPKRQTRKAKPRAFDYEDESVDETTIPHLATPVKPKKGRTARARPVKLEDCEDLPVPETRAEKPKKKRNVKHEPEAASDVKLEEDLDAGEGAMSAPLPFSDSEAAPADVNEEDGDEPEEKPKRKAAKGAKKGKGKGKAKSKAK